MVRSNHGNLPVHSRCPTRALHAASQVRIGLEVIDDYHMGKFRGFGTRLNAPYVHTYMHENFGLFLPIQLTSFLLTVRLTSSPHESKSSEEQHLLWRPRAFYVVSRKDGHLVQNEYCC